MRHFLLPALFLSSMHLPACAQSDFSGVWTAMVCPSGVKSDAARCAHFVLELFQRQDRLCGSHLFATPGATQMDDGSGLGGGPSLSGTVTGNAASVAVTSGRANAGAPVQAELTLGRGTLQWHRLGKPGRNDLLPTQARFVKSRAKTLFNPVFAQQLSAACSMIPTPQERDGTPATTPPHQQLHPAQKTGLAENRRQF